MTASEFNPDNALGEAAGQPLAELATIQIPCAVCVLNAVRQGVDYTHVPPNDLVGQVYGGHYSIHESVTTISGTEVCWYHVDTAAKAAGL